MRDICNRALHCWVELGMSESAVGKSVSLHLAHYMAISICGNMMRAGQQ
jgi:hypothetical protein